MPIATVNPATGETLRTFEAASAEDVDAAITRADDAYRSYRHTAYADRARWMHAAADLLDKEVEDVARLLTTEMGKTIRAARAEVQKCAKGARFYADNAERFLADEAADAGAVGASRAFVRYAPLGPILAVMPWNFPLWQVVRFAAPALMAGNVGLLKHASNVPQAALYLEDLFRRAGFPSGTFQALLIGSDLVERVLADPRVAAATLTGSEAAGASVAATAGREIKKTVLELGGSDAFLVLPSADLAQAAAVATTARVQNNGQSCIAAKRFLVHEAAAEEFERLFAERMRALVVGDPMDEGTDVGPLVNEQGRADVEELVADAVAKGARVVVGGERLEGPGFFYAPTIVADVTEDMRMYREEVFGPVASLYRVPDLDSALKVANATSFGLGSNVWTSDPDERKRCVDELEAGSVFVNGMVTSYPELPFGGIKRSGYGRELSVHGLREFCNAKAVWVGEGAAADPGAKNE